MQTPPSPCCYSVWRSRLLFTSSGVSAVEGRERQLFCNDVLGAAIGDFVPPGEGLHTYICRGRTEEGRKSAERSSWHQVLSSENVGSPLCACAQVGIAVSSSAGSWTVSTRAWTTMGSCLPRCRWMMLLQVFAHACTCANVRVASRTCAIFDTSLPTAVVAMLIV